MAESKPVQQTPSRNAVIAIVVLLIVVAIAGIVLAGRRTASPAPGTAAALPTPPAAPTPQVDETPTGPRPNEVAFVADSERMSPESSESLAKFVEGARKVGGMVRLSARYVAGPDKAKAVELAKSRTAVVRHALLADGIKTESMQVELVEMPAGTLPEREANRVGLSLR